MKKTFKFVLLLITLFLLSSCDNIQVVDMDEIQNDIEVRDKIDQVFALGSDYDFLTVSVDASAEIDLNGGPVTYVPYTESEEYVYSTHKSKIYYYNSYIDNHSNQNIEFINMNSNNALIKHTVENGNYQGMDEVNFDVYEEKINSFESEDFYLLFENQHYQKIEDNHYGLSCSYAKLKEESGFKNVLNNISLDGVSINDEIGFRLTYKFTDTSVLITIHYSYYVNEGIVYMVNSIVTLKASFSDNPTQVDFSPKDYHQKAFLPVNENTITFEEDENVLVEVDSEVDNVIKYHLTPGYYYFHSDKDNLDKFYITGEVGGHYYPRNYIRIITEGIYYLHMDVSYCEKDVIRIEKASLENIKDVENPQIYQSSLIQTDLVANEPIQYMLEKNTEAHILKIEFLDKPDYTMVCVNGIEFCHNENINYIFVKDNYDFILSIVCDESISVELEVTKVSVNASNSIDLDTMEELPLWSTVPTIGYVNFSFDPNNNVKYFKLVITETKRVHISFKFWVKTRNGVAMHFENPLIPLYNSDGVLLSESFVDGELEPGTYYVKMNWYKSEYACGYIYYD